MFELWTYQDKYTKEEIETYDEDGKVFPEFVHGISVEPRNMEYPIVRATDSSKPGLQPGRLS